MVNVLIDLSYGSLGCTHFVFDTLHISYRLFLGWWFTFTIEASAWWVVLTLWSKIAAISVAYISKSCYQRIQSFIFVTVFLNFDEACLWCVVTQVGSENSLNLCVCLLASQCTMVITHRYVYRLFYNLIFKALIW
jgi:hypothetical protein